MAAVWKGMISFGLVNIPIELHGAVKSSRPHFRLLHGKDKSPVSYERICQRDGTAVAWDDLVKGYEYAKGKFVVLTKDDFKTAAVEKTKAVDILDFVPAAEIDDRYFDTPYYALPGKGGERGYVLLRQAIADSGRIGVGKVVLRETQHLAAVSVVDDAIVLTMMRFADELLDPSRLTFPKRVAARARELEMAKKLIESLSSEWKPEQYKDDYRANLMRVINAKLAGKEPDVEPEEDREATGVVDLMERLRQSIEGRGKSAKGAKGAKPRPPRRAASSAAKRPARKSKSSARP